MALGDGHHICCQIASAEVTSLGAICIVGMRRSREGVAWNISTVFMCHGAACIKGTRIMLLVVLDALSDATDWILAQYPTLETDDIHGDWVRSLGGAH